MTDILGTDLKLQSDDLVVATDGDLDLVNGIDCLNQDLSNAFRTPYYFWGLTHQAGSRMQEFVEGGAEDFLITDLKVAVNEVMRGEPRVQRDSWKVALAEDPANEQVEVTISYLPVESSTVETLKFIVG